MLYDFFTGALMICCLIAGLFFLKFWRKTHDTLFRSFSLAFFILTFERMVLAYLGSENEPSQWVYLIRLGAFLLIIFAIISKNKVSAKTSENT